MECNLSNWERGFVSVLVWVSYRSDCLPGLLDGKRRWRTALALLPYSLAPRVSVRYGTYSV